MDKGDYELTLPVPIPDIVGKLIIFILPSGASKGFMKAFKALIKPFQALQRSVKLQIQVNF